MKFEKDEYRAVISDFLLEEVFQSKESDMFDTLQRQ